MKQHYEYEIVLDSQLGPRHGYLLMEEVDNAINGVLSLLDFENTVTGRREEKMLFLHHELHTLVSQLTCRTELEMQGDSLMGTIYSEFGKMKIRGKKRTETECPTE